MNSAQNNNLDKVGFGVTTNTQSCGSQLQLSKQVISKLQNGNTGAPAAMDTIGSYRSFCCPTIPDPATAIKTLNSIGSFKCLAVMQPVNDALMLAQNV